MAGRETSFSLVDVVLSTSQMLSCLARSKLRVCFLCVFTLMFATPWTLPRFPDVAPLPVATVSISSSRPSLGRKECTTGEFEFTLVLTANVVGGSEVFLDRVLPPEAMVLRPVAKPNKRNDPSDADKVSVSAGRREAEVKTFDEVVLMLKNHTDCFDKVFINHPLGFPQDFLEALFQMQKRYVSVTHDYYWALEEPQPTFAGWPKVRQNKGLQRFWPRLELKAQDRATQQIFSALGSFRTLEYAPMPDYVASDTTKYEARKKLLIGCIGAISDIKGNAALVHLANIADVFVFGRVYVLKKLKRPARLRSEKYKTISELNDLLLRERPNVLVVPPLWPETYSYTLTLAMLTELPIIVRKDKDDFDFAVTSRAKQYQKAHFHDFRDISSVTKLAEEVKARHFKLIKDEVDVPAQWKALLRPRLHNVVVVLDMESQLERRLASLRTHIANLFVVFCARDFNVAEDKDMLVVPPPTYAAAPSATTLERVAGALSSAAAALEDAQVMFDQLFVLTTHPDVTSLRLRNFSNQILTKVDHCEARTLSLTQTVHHQLYELCR